MAETAVLSCMVAGVFIHFYRSDRCAIMDEVRNQARILIRQVLLTRSWLADMGGVYVKQRGNLKPNPYLGKMGKIVGKDGHNYLLRNPAMVTRELSEYADRQGLYRFRLTSDRLVNPANAPDSTERWALKLFRKGVTREYAVNEVMDKKRVFRLIVPVYIEKSCLRCHQYQGYRVGQLRGCISVIIPSGAALRKIAQHRNSLFVSAIIILFAAVFTLYFLTRFLTLQPLSHLLEKVRKFERDVGAVFTPSSRKDEIGALENGFYEMAQTIRQSHQEMRREISKATEEQRRLNAELNEMNLKLMEKNTIMTNFLATVSHELRTPLTTIKGGVEFLLKTSEEEEQKRFLKVVERNIRQLIRMVNNLIDLAKIELKKVELEIEEINLRGLIDEALILFEEMAKEKNITLVYKGPEELVIPADYRRINQVILNLLHNALKFSPPGGKVTVTLESDEEYAYLSVADEGPGIEPETIPALFSRYRSHIRGRKAGEGSGLGLAIAEGLVTAHGGRIEVKSVPGKGTTFTIVLPLREEKPKEE